MCKAGVLCNSPYRRPADLLVSVYSRVCKQQIKCGRNRVARALIAPPLGTAGRRSGSTQLRPNPAAQERSTSFRSLAALGGLSVAAFTARREDPPTRPAERLRREVEGKWRARPPVIYCGQRRAANKPAAAHRRRYRSPLLPWQPFPASHMSHNRRSARHDHRTTTAGKAGCSAV